MKKIFVLSVCFLIMAAASRAQEKSDVQNALSSESLNKQSKELDNQIKSLNRKIADIIKKYNLLKTLDVRVVPYQMNYLLGQDFIQMEKHSFRKDDLYERDIIGIDVKKIKIYTDGQSISKIESQIYEHGTYSGSMNIVSITDPSPMAENTDGIIFGYTLNGKNVLDNKKLGEVKNTTAHPIRNELKRDFLIPHLTYFSNSLLFIAEAYYKGLKDFESGMADFLKKAVK
jgi:hypothetical protein